MSQIKTGNFSIEELENVHITIGSVVGAIEKEAEVEEDVGPTPCPGIKDLREWDFKLFNRYEPIYTPVCDQCCYCTFGKCDLSKNKEGACGIDLASHQAREFLLRVITGAAAHSAHGRHLLHYLIDKYGADHPIDVGASNLKTPIIQLVTGSQPETLGDLEKALDYVEEQLTQLLATIQVGQEGASIDFESKALHGGMIDHVGMEVSDVAQISCLNMPKSEENTSFSELGMGCIDSDKPMVLTIGHNVAAVTHIIDYIDEKGLDDEIELGGLCCTALDMSRYKSEGGASPISKVIGPISKELKFIRSGVPDVIVVDEQCVRADVLREAKELSMPVIATNEKIMYGLKDRTNDDVEDIVSDLVSGKEAGALILDFDKVGEIAVRVAREIAPVRKDKGLTAIPSDTEFQELVNRCIHCQLCENACPVNLPISDAFRAAESEDMGELEKLHDLCIGCGKCEPVCPKDIPVLNVIEKASKKAIREERGRVRVGRGQISDPEIREEGVNLVLGTTPGIIAMVGCSNYPEGTKDIYKIADEMLRRNYIVVVSGCAAMDLGMYQDDDGNTLYEKYPAKFSKGNLINVGSCVSNSHIAATAIKVAAIFAQRQISGNYEEIADYVMNRIGATALAWGAYSQKASAIASGCNRLGIPVIVGPHGSKYRRALIGRPYSEEKWTVYDARNGEIMPIASVPEFLITTAGSVEEVMPMLAKNCIRPSDNNMGRMIKLTHYIELSQKYLGVLPNDWHIFVRNEQDLPLAKRDELLKILESEHGWEIDWKKKKILSGPSMKFDISAQPTNLERLCRGQEV
ncbi:CO dehydrogenase/acetyl-CoA synthase complex, epsilon subunit [Methanosalsum zhilinae DSM 4017]|uniref:Acetyl-CoA decarbonylase/synthase complex subunit alpha n=1 Tax=Methanosalsum zhilinae (strain DSM 4017 / NBRC 107636 / OCM 62 / WeN5) TaxID=679901 RepID=F7XLS5_METZD|nr:CO dehydrogenase/acetyl-CoA synthase complex subunit alpha [Methanosalsum zhilinae]AEH60993.1 CO dehydrogenase/acetyl-CoA synthase complex, epsilon subunit [Methanosalsum zhilinae DSM 4017]